MKKLSIKIRTCDSIKADFLVTTLFFVALITICIVINYPSPTGRNQRFAYEYGNIAQALVAGNGFSNPFLVRSGPTAWMPPLYVILIAAVFKVFGAKSLHSLWVLLTIKFLGIAVSLFLLLRIVDRGNYCRFKYLLVPLFLMYVFAYRFSFLYELHDIWLTLLLTCMILYTLTTLVGSGFKRGIISLLLVSLVTPLANPALGLALLLILLILTVLFLLASTGVSTPRMFQVNRKTSHRQIRILSLAVTLFIFAVFLWTARNFFVFSTFIPIKSNFWFDFYNLYEFED